MSRLTPVIALFVCLAAGAACDDDSPTSPSNTATFTATLSPASEVPPVTNADASGSGSATITLNLTRDAAGTITAATADFNATLTGFVANTSVSAAHIHTGAVGVAGPVTVDTGLTAGQLILANGSGTLIRTGVTVTPAVAQSIITSPGGFYLNVHTVLTPSGAVRGQLVRQ